MDKNTGNGERKDAKGNATDKSKNDAAADKDKAKDKSGNVQ